MFEHSEEQRRNNPLWWAFEPPLCECRHYLSIHNEKGCPGQQDLHQKPWPIFYLFWTLFIKRPCPCKVRRLKFEQKRQESDNDGT